MTRLTFTIIVVMFAVVNSQHLAYTFKHNLFAIHLLQSHTEVLSNAPWASHSWWNTLCRHENSSLEPDWFERFNTRADFTYLQAIFTIVQGDCYGAVEILKTIISHQPNTHLEQELLAYVYSMSGEWIESATVVPVNDIVEGNWTLRRYWGNVLLRAGIAGEPNLMQESESLLGIYRPDSDITLFEYWFSRGDLVPAFEELRWVIAESDESDGKELVEAYQLMARYYVAHQVATNPESGRWPYLQAYYDKVAIPMETNNAQPSNILEYQWDEQWVLWGFDLDEVELALGPFVHLTLYWLYFGMAREKELLIERRIVQNYVPDAGFEWRVPVNGVRPFGYNALYNNKYPYPYEIMLDGTGQQFCFLNNQGLMDSGIQTHWFPSPTGSNRLLVGGAYRTEKDGKVTFGVRWRSDDGEIRNEHVIAGESSSYLQYAVEIMEIPLQTEEMAFQILQFQSTGMACFDNLFMFLLDGPGREAR